MAERAGACRVIQAVDSNGRFIRAFDAGGGGLDWFKRAFEVGGRGAEIRWMEKFALIPPP